MEQQLIIENVFQTMWFICDTAYISHEDNGWNVVGKRGDTENPYKIKWNIHNNITKWLPKTNCHLYESNNGRNPPSYELLDINELVQVELLTHSTSLGEFYEYKLMFKGDTVLNCYSWMGNFISAWKSGELFRNKK
jgi:hypothetical protein